MAFHREATGFVIQLLADIFPDAGQLAATGRGRGLGFVMDLGARQLWRQRPTLRRAGLGLRLPAALGQPLQLLLDGCRVLVNEVLEQVVLLAVDPFAAFAETVALEQRDLVGELFVADAVTTDSFIALDQLGVLLVQPGQQLRRHLAKLCFGELIKIDRRVHGHTMPVR
jgi:hypothetical protein